MKTLFRPPHILVLFLMVVGVGAYFYLSQKGTSTESLDYGTYLPGKVFVAFYGAGIEKGKFYPGGTYEKVTDLEYVQGDTRSNEHKGTWSAGTDGITLDADTDIETFIPVTPVRSREGILLVDPHLIAGDGGHVIGESLDSIFLYIQTAAPHWSSMEEAVMELGSNGR